MQVNYQPADFQQAVANLKMVLNHGMQGISTSQGKIQKLEKRDRWRIVTLIRLYRDYIASFFVIQKYAKVNEVRAGQIKKILEADVKLIKEVVASLTKKDTPKFLLEEDGLYKVFKTEIKTLKAWQDFVKRQDSAVLQKTKNSLEPAWKASHSLGNDAWNKLLQKAEDNKSYYSLITIYGVDIPHDYEARKISLLDWKRMDQKRKDLVIKHFQLEESLKQVRKEVDFEKKLEELDDQVLDSFTIYDMKLPWDKSPLKLGLVKDEELKELALEKIGIASVEQYKYFSSKRIENLNKALPENIDEANIAPNNIMQQSLLTWRHLSPKKIMEVADHVKPPGLFLFLDFEKIKELDFARLPRLVKKSILVELDEIPHTEERNQKFASFSDDQVENLFDVMEKKHFLWVSEEQISKIDYSKLDEKQIISIFDKGTVAEQKRRFAKIPNEQINIVVAKLDIGPLRFVSDQHIAALDFTSLPKEKMAKIFNRGDRKEELRLVSLLNKSRVECYVEKFEDWHLELLSDNQIQELDFSKVDKDKIALIFSQNGAERQRKFALLSSKQVHDIMAKIDDWNWRKLVTDEQLIGLDTARLQNQEIKTLFPSTKTNANGSYYSSRTNNGVVKKEQHQFSSGENVSKETLEDNQRRFAIFTGLQVKSMLDKLTDELKILITEKQKQEMAASP